MNGGLKMFRMLKVVIFLICFSFLIPALLFAKEDTEVIAKRKAQLAEFFGKNVCGDCHGATPKYTLNWARQGYDRSMHKNGGKGPGE